MQTRGHWVSWSAHLNLNLEGLSNGNVKLVTPGRGQYWPQGQNRNILCRGPKDDATYLIWELRALRLLSSRCSKFQLSKPFFGPGDLIMQWTGTILTTFVDLDPSNIVAKFGQIWPSSFGEVVWKKLLTDDGRRTNDDPKSSPEVTQVS